MPICLGGLIDFIDDGFVSLVPQPAAQWALLLTGVEPLLVEPTNRWCLGDDESSPLTGSFMLASSPCWFSL